MRSLMNVPGGLVVCEIYTQVHAIGVELERMNPKLYVDICKQVVLIEILNQLSLDMLDANLLCKLVLQIVEKHL